MRGAELIKQLRKMTGLNQTDFGEKIGVPQDRISLYENGKIRVIFDSFIEWCGKCGVEFKIFEKE